MYICLIAPLEVENAKQAFDCHDKVSGCYFLEKSILAIKSISIFKEKSKS